MSYYYKALVYVVKIYYFQNIESSSNYTSKALSNFPIYFSNFAYALFISFFWTTCKYLSN